MSSVNKVILVGRLGQDPQQKVFPSGGSITSVTLATSYRYRNPNDPNGNWTEETEWHNVVFRGNLASIAHQYLRKGSQCYVEGRLRTRKWQDQQGQNRYTTEVVADNLVMLGSRNDQQAAQPQQWGAPAAAQAPQATGYTPQGQFAPATAPAFAPNPAPAPAAPAYQPPVAPAANPVVEPFSEEEDIPF